jgi:hypothetical protein
VTLCGTRCCLQLDPFADTPDWCSGGLGDAEADSSLRSFGRSLDARVISDACPRSQCAMHVAFLGLIGLQDGQRMLPLRLGAVGAMLRRDAARRHWRLSPRAVPSRSFLVAACEARCTARSSGSTPEAREAAREAWPRRWPRWIRRVGASRGRARASRDRRRRQGELAARVTRGSRPPLVPKHRDEPRTPPRAHTGQEIAMG